MTGEPPEHADGNPAGGSARRRSGWSLLDQVFSSASNFLVSLEVARTASPRATGHVAVAFTLFQVFLTLQRALVSEVYLVTKSADGTRPGAAARDAAGSSLALSGAVAAAVLAIAAVVGGGQARALVVLAGFLPFLALQDLWRLVLVAHYRPQAAVLNDVVWLAAMVPWFAWVEVSDRQPPAWQYVAAWTGPALLCALLGLVQTGVLPRPARARRFWAANRAVWRALSRETLSSAAVGTGAAFLLAAVKGSDALGRYRSTQAIFGAVGMAQLAAGLIVVPEGARLAQVQRHRSLRRLAMGTSALLSSAALIWGIALYALPVSAGRRVFGDSWPSFRPVVVPLTLLMAASGVSIGAAMALRALGRVDLSARARTRSLGVSAAGVIAGVALWGPEGLALGLLPGEALNATLLWMFVRRTLRGNESGAAPDISRAGPPSG